MDFNKHAIKNENDNPFHSSGLAVVASGDKLGSTSVESFKQRQQIERNRQIIQGYRHSKIGNARGIAHVGKSDEELKKELKRSKIQIPERQNLQQYNVNNTQRHFKEPTSRNYNPYA